MLQQILRAAICALFLIIPAGSAYAAPEIIEADGVSMMGDNDTPKSARDAARNEAMRAATERAGVYIESVSEVQDYALTRDEIRTVAAAVLRVLDEQVTPELVGDAWRYRVHLVCSVDTDGIDLAALARDKAELARLTRERDALQRENNDLRSRPTMPRGAVLIPPAPVYGETGGVSVPVYGEAPRSHEPTPTPTIFADVEAMIMRGEYAHAVADLSLLLQDPSVTGDARAYAYVLRGRTYYDQHSPRLARADFDAAERTPHTDGTYPIWRLYEYRGLIAYDAGRWEDAVSDLMSAWDASDKTDDTLWMRLRRAERRAEQERRHRVRGDGGARSWEVVVDP